MAKKKDKEVGLDFYRFQRIEAQKNSMIWKSLFSFSFPYKHMQSAARFSDNACTAVQIAFKRVFGSVELG